MPMLYSPQAIGRGLPHFSTRNNKRRATQKQQRANPGTIMKLIASLTSPYARKVRIVMAEKRIECEFAPENVGSRYQGRRIQSARQSARAGAGRRSLSLTIRA